MIISPWTYTFFRMMSTVSNLMVRSLWWGRLHHDAGEIPQPRSQAGRPVAGRPVTMSGEFIPHYQIYVISYNWCTVWSSKHLEVWKPVNVQFESVMNHDVDSEEWEWLGGQSWLSYRLYIYIIIIYIYIDIIRITIHIPSLLVKGQSCCLSTGSRPVMAAP